MKMNNDVYEMTRILSGEASKEECEHFYAVLEANPEKKRAFEMLEKEWTTASDAMLYKSLDVDMAWKRHTREYLDDSRKEKKSANSIWKWAAVLVMAAGLSFYFFNRPTEADENWVSYSTGPAETLPVQTPDGSVVTLNENSTISYAFANGMRKVNFSGEAFFEVARDPEQPFVVEMENAYVKVLGTAFNVKTIGNSVDVAVREGQVEFGPSNRSEQVLLKAGSSGFLFNKKLTFVDSVDDNVFSWYTRKLAFEQVALPDVLSHISHTYHISFRYDTDQLKDCRLTADFDNEELADVLETLHTIFKVDFKKDNRTYIVTGKACERGE